MEYDVIELTADDRQSVEELLSVEEEMIAEDILAQGTRYWGAIINGRLVGAIGCEYQGRYGLVRSACVLPEFRGMGIGAKLTETLTKAARDMGLEALYLFSTLAGPYWLKNGFCEVPVAEVIERLSDAYQVKLFDKLGWLPTEETFKYAL